MSRIEGGPTPGRQRGSVRHRVIAVVALVAFSVALGLRGAGARGISTPTEGSPPFPLRFDSEVVRLVIRGDSLEVEGIYRFLCELPSIPQAWMLYPYPVDSLMAGARMVTLDGRVPPGPWRPLEFRAAPGLPGVAWRIPPNSCDTLDVRAMYRQGLRGRYARYIVTSTRFWSRPLRSARFEVYLPSHARPRFFSFPFVRTVSAGRVIFVYEAADFMPDRDILVQWAP